MPSSAELQALADALNGAFLASAFVPSSDGTGLALLDTSAPGGNLQITGASGDWTLVLTGASRTTPLVVPLFGGFTLHLVGFTATVKAGKVTASGPGSIQLPFFNQDDAHPERLDFELTSGDDGVGLRLADAQVDPKRQDNDGNAVLSYRLTKAQGSASKTLAVDFAIQQLSLLKKDGKYWIKFDADLTLTISTAGAKDPDFATPKA